MVEYYPRLWRLLSLGSLLLVLVFSVFPVLDNWSLVLSGLLVLFIGIPHGAADHHLFSRLYRQQYGRSALYGFYLGYLGLMGICFLLWWWLPSVALLLFIGASAYHFGQSNFHYLPAKLPLRKGYYWIWGGFVVFAPVLLHFGEARPILEELLRTSLPSLSVQLVQLVLGIWGLILIVLITYLGRQGIARRLIFRELVSLLVLSIVFYSLPLLLAFSLYFAAWHALPSAMDQIRFFQQAEDKNFRSRKYLLKIIPYSIVALLGLAVIIVSWQMESMAINWAIIFAFLSAVTLPHMLVLDRVYKDLETTLASAKGDYKNR